MNSVCCYNLFLFFFFQAEDGIRDLTVTGVQTCALPILRRPGRPLSGGVLLGLILHDARAHRERPDRSREEHARQLCVPDQNGGAYPERQPDVLFEPQPAAILRRHGRAVRACDGYHPCPAIPRRDGGGTRVLDERGGASRTRGGPGVPPRRAAP